LIVANMPKSKKTSPPQLMPLGVIKQVCRHLNRMARTVQTSPRAEVVWTRVQASNWLPNHAWDRELWVRQC
jgi:hypothetical protein